MTKYTVTGMSCAACSARVEKAVSAVEGVTSCTVNLLTNSMGVEGSASEADIIKADPARLFVVPSAPGKRFSDDTKVTDMLYNCYEMAAKGNDITEMFTTIMDRYNSIIEELELELELLEP